MSNRDISSRWIVLTGFLALFGACGLDDRPAIAQGANSSREHEPGSSQTIQEVRSLVAEIESQAESQREQLRRTEASLRRARALLDRLQGGRGKANAQLSREQDRQRHATLPAQAVVETMEWKWSDEQANPQYSAGRLAGGYTADFAPEPGEPWALRIRLIRDGQEVYSWKGHSHSVFVQRGDVVYYADFRPGTNGCSVVAFDLKGRRQLWRVGLWGIGSRNHSKYNNLINMALDGNYIVVYGNEGFGRYIELVDPQTGQTVGHRLVPKDEKDPAVGQKLTPDGSKARP